MAERKCSGEHKINVFEKEFRVRSQIDVYLSCTNRIASCFYMIRRPQCLARFAIAAFCQKNSNIQEHERIYSVWMHMQNRYAIRSMVDRSEDVRCYTVCVLFLFSIISRKIVAFRLFCAHIDSRCLLENILRWYTISMGILPAVCCECA